MCRNNRVSLTECGCTKRSDANRGRIEHIGIQSQAFCNAARGFAQRDFARTHRLPFAQACRPIVQGGDYEG